MNTAPQAGAAPATEHWQVEYTRLNGSTFRSAPYADRRSADFIAAAGRATKSLVGITSCVVVPAVLLGAAHG